MEDASDPGERTSSTEAADGITHYTTLDLRSVRWGLWNVRGFVQKDHCRLRECVIQTMNLDIIYLCETCLFACKQMGNPEYTLYMCVCYLPPLGSSRGDKLQEVFDIQRSQILQFQDKGGIMICGNFNA